MTTVDIGGESAGAEGQAGEGFPLTPLQEGMLFHYLSEPGSGVDLEQIVCTLRHPVDPGRMEAAWNHAARRHRRLGASFEWVGVDAPRQHEEVVRIPLAVHDLAGATPSEQEARFSRFLEEDRATAFELDRPPLVRLALFRLAEREHRLVWTFPHILMDGRSFPIVLREVFAHYDAEPGAAGEHLEPSPAYATFVAWERARDTTADEAFWRSHLADFRAPNALLEQVATQGPASKAGSTGTRGPRRETSLRLTREQTDALRALGEGGGPRLHTLVYGAWALAIARYTGDPDIVFGAVRAGRSTPAAGVADMVGVLINALPVRTRIDDARPFRAWLADLEAGHRQLRPFEQTPLVRIQQWSEVPPGRPLFESLIVYDHAHLDTMMRGEAPQWSDRSFELLERTTYPLTLYGYGEDRLLLKLAHDVDRLPAKAADRLLGHVAGLLRSMAARPDAAVGELEMLTSDERLDLLDRWNRTDRPLPPGATLHGLVIEQIEKDGGRIAVACGDRTLPAGDLLELSGRFASHLAQMGIGKGDLVGISLPRSIDQVVVLLGILRTGAAYVPLDPAYPADRLEFMVRDSGLRAIVRSGETRSAFDAGSVLEILLDRDRARILAASAQLPHEPDAAASPGDRAYVIYTSGSTGRPKGVEVEHRNVVNFLLGMDEVLSPGSDSGDATGAATEDAQRPGAWLSLTSLSFDISVLELFWPLSRGRTLVLHREEVGPDATAGEPFILGTSTGTDTGAPAPGAARADRPMEFSLFYFASDSGQDPHARYRLLLEGAKFADAEGFSAIWTPERHFHAFGGLYPNPAVTGAAVAAITSRVGIRAGSVVLPLHHPVRVAEEWAVVDNLSGGRVGISIASGWHPDDFLLAPENHADRKAIMFRSAETIQRLWRGEKVAFDAPGGRQVEVGILPRPVQPELPIWVTTAGNVETYREAGRMGARVLTHLLGQTTDELEERIRAYREAWDEAGHPPGGAHVSLMLHAFVGEDDESVRETVREPMKAYLRTSVGLIRNFADSWTAYRRKAGKEPVAQGGEFDQLSDEDLDALLEFAFNRYFETSGLFGSPERCVRMARELHAIGVDEIACLIDFGVETDRVLDHLPWLSQVRRQVMEGRAGDARHGADGLVTELEQHGVTHVQCTPSQLRMLLADPATREALRGLPVFLVGGEALPAALARELQGVTGGRVLNMYGPTETTIWSTTCDLSEVGQLPDDGVVPIGRPIANTRIHVLDGALRPVPVGVPGELFIGGEGVARGYLGRPELTAERFLPDPFAGDARSEPAGDDPSPRMYRTGDRVRYREDGVLEFLGRTDHQVKLRGHRIETGEIEAALQAHPGVSDSAVILREDAPGDQRLAAYLVAAPGTDAGALEGSLRAALAETLPAIMIPSSFTFLERLPLTPNRKVDRRALPAPARVRTPGRSGEDALRTADALEVSIGSTAAAAPATDEHASTAGAMGAGGERAEPDPAVARRVASIWKELLGVDAVGLDDNFFDLGGHSLLTVQVHGRLREAFDRELRITDLFRYPTVRTLARFLGNDANGGAPAEAGEPVTSALDRGALRRQALRRRAREG